jgi:hypothetical protein
MTGREALARMRLYCSVSVFVVGPIALVAALVGATAAASVSGRGRLTRAVSRVASEAGGVLGGSDPTATTVVLVGLLVLAALVATLTYAVRNP